jgi:GNAT superfamily N-acetyltransferase
MFVKEIDWLTIEKVWRLNLWPGRVSAIEPFSAMRFMDDKYDMDFSRTPRAFLGGFVGDILVAVNSVHLAEKYMARSRGLWVAPEHRGHHHGRVLLKETNTLAEQMGAEAIWSFSRQNSIKTYESAGFIRVSSWLGHGEFGPNAYVIHSLR